MAPGIKLCGSFEENQYHQSIVHFKASRKSTGIKQKLFFLQLRTFLNFRAFPGLQMLPGWRTRDCELRAFYLGWRGAMLVLEIPLF